MKPYPWTLLPHLAACIESGEDQKAHENAQAYLDLIKKDSSRTLTAKKFRALAMISFMMRAAIQGGMSAEKIFNEQFPFYDSLQKVKSWHQVEKLFHQFLDQMLDHVKRGITTNLERLIAKMQKDLFDSPESCLGLKQYAYQAGVSSGYLSVKFKEIVGDSFRDSLRKARMQKAKAYLKESNLKIRVISKMVGLEDPSQFVADFKKEMGITPGVFRKRNQKI